MTCTDVNVDNHQVELNMWKPTVLGLKIKEACSQNCMTLEHVDATDLISRASVLSRQV